MKKQNKTYDKNSFRFKVFNSIVIIISVFLIAILVVNTTLIVKSYTEPNKIPTFAGYFPMFVMTDSMQPVIKSGDLIIAHVEDPQNIEPGDIISFFDPASKGTSIVTHRVQEALNRAGKLSFLTKGDANNAEDIALVPSDNLVGVYCLRIPLMGNVAMFMQSTVGVITCIVLPLFAMFGYDALRRRQAERINKQDKDALLAEIEALRAEKAAREEK